MATTNELRDAVKTTLWGVLFVVGGAWLWYILVGNPFHDLALICRGETVPGYITDTWEDAESGDEGGTLWFHGVEYDYTLPDGREFTQTSSGDGRLKDELRDLRQPYPIEVEYLPDDPDVSRIKGNGSPTIFDWVWRKAGLGSLLLAMFVAPGISVMRDGIRKYRDCEQRLSALVGDGQSIRLNSSNN
jgi:hypothetical protein